MRKLNKKFSLANGALVAAMALALTGCMEESTKDSIGDGGLPGGTPEAPASGTDFVVFNDTVNPYWGAWDCCGGTTPANPVEASEYGMVTEFSIGEQAAVVGFVRSESRGALDASAYDETGTLEFDIKLMTAPTGGDTTWNVKLESNGGVENGATGEFAEVTITAPTDTWQHVSINIAELVNRGLDTSSIDNILIFPAWGTGAGAIYRIDNVEFVIDGNDAEESTPDPRPDEDEGQKLNLSLAVEDFGGALSVQGVSDPEAVALGLPAAMSASTIIETTKPAAAEIWAGTTVGDTSALALTENRSKVSLWVYSEQSSVPILLKVEDQTDETKFVETTSYTTTANAWEKITFDFSAPTNGIIVDSYTYDKKSVFFNFGSNGTDEVYYWDDMTFVEGDEIIEEPPIESPEDETTFLFEDAVNFGWMAWDCCGGSVATLVDEADRGKVVSFNKVVNDSVLGFSSRLDHDVPAGAELLDVSTWTDTGTFSFDMKVTNGAEHAWKLKIEAPGSHVEVDLPEAPILDTWQTYTFNLSDLAAVDQSQIDLLMVFPAWGQGAGATYLIDNVKFTSLGNDTPTEPETPIDPDPLPPLDMTGNLVPNGDFELGNADWNGDFQVTDGVANLSIIGGEKRIEQQRVAEGTALANTNYTLTFDIRGSAENGAIFNGNVQSFHTGGVSATYVIDAFVPTANWERKTYNFTSGNNVDWGMNILLGPVCGAVAGCAADVFIDNITIQQQ